MSIEGKKVDLRPIQNLYLENLLEVEKSLGPDELSKLFQGTDTYYNSKTGMLDAIIDGKIVSHSLADEAEGVNFVKNADLDKNGELTLEELREFLKVNDFPVDPEPLFNAIEHSIKVRYAMVAKNAASFVADVAFKPLLDSLDTYNSGIYLDDLRNASSVMPLNGLTKTATNVLTFVGNAGRLITQDRGPVPLLSKDTFSDDYFFADHWAKNSAENSYKKRSLAIQEFREIIAAGLLKGEAWAKEGNFDQAFQALKPESQRLLSKDIPAKKIHDILSIPEDQKRHQALLAFAEAERPGFLGYFGGNATGFSTASFFNYTGRHNNLFFARSVLSFLRHTHTEDPNFDKEIRKKSSQMTLDMLGEGGNFTTTFAWALTGLPHLLSFGHYEQVPWRSWGDESRMDAVGRGLDAGLTLFLSYKSLRSLSSAADLAKASKLEEVANVVKKSPLRTLLNELSPLAKASAFETRRLALGSEKVLLGKFWGPVASMVGTYYLTKGTIAKEFKDSYNPFETNHELSMDPYPDPTKPDPVLYPEIKK